MFTCVGVGHPNPHVVQVSTLQEVKCDKFLVEGFWKYFHDSKVTVHISLSYFTCFYMKLTYHEARELEKFLRAENGISVRIEQLVWKRWWWPVRWGWAWVGLWVPGGRQYPGVTQHPSVTLFWALGTRRKMIHRCYQVSRDVQPRALRKAAQLSALLSARAPIVGRGGEDMETLPERWQLTQVRRTWRLSKAGTWWRLKGVLEGRVLGWGWKAIKGCSQGLKFSWRFDPRSKKIPLDSKPWKHIKTDLKLLNLFDYTGLISKFGVLEQLLKIFPSRFGSNMGGPRDDHSQMEKDKYHMMADM